MQAKAIWSLPTNAGYLPVIIPRYLPSLRLGPGTRNENIHLLRHVKFAHLAFQFPCAPSLSSIDLFPITLSPESSYSSLSIYITSLLEGYHGHHEA
jgi:hypothetical protein